MKLGTLRLQDISGPNRLDVNHYLSTGVTALRRLDRLKAAGLKLARFGDPGGLAKVTRPKRLRGVFVSNPKAGRPYLTPTDTFHYLPFSKDYLATFANENADDYVVAPGVLLQTRSGRNLGPSEISDQFLQQFAVSDDMLRADFGEPNDAYFAHAYLMTPTGQSILRRDKTGSVIDHIDEPHLREQKIPQLNEAVVRDATRKMKEAIDKREKARLMLQAAQLELEAELPMINRGTPLRTGWGIKQSALGSRVDAAFHDPFVKKARAALRKAGGQFLHEHALVTKPGGRYRPIYVGAVHGRPLLSGSNILQYAIVKPQFLAVRVLKDAKPYELASGTVVFQADGRAEEALARPVVVTEARDGWLASGHVGRLVAKEGTSWGWLFLAFNSSLVQAQVKALACGSVIDALYEHDVANVILPPMDKRGENIEVAWKLMGEAEGLRRDAVLRVESEITRLVGEGIEAEPEQSMDDG